MILYLIDAHINTVYLVLTVLLVHSQDCMFDSMYTHKIVSENVFVCVGFLVMVIINFVLLISSATALISSYIISCAIIVHKTLRDS